MFRTVKWDVLEALQGAVQYLGTLLAHQVEPWVPEPTLALGASSHPKLALNLEYEEHVRP